MCCRSQEPYSTAQIRRLGVKGLQTDDYIVTFGAAWYTVLCVAFNQMLQGAGSNLMTDQEVSALTPEITAERVLGSKWVFVTEHAMLLTIWSMKVALLLLYTRLTYVPTIPTSISYPAMLIKRQIWTRQPKKAGQYCRSLDSMRLRWRLVGVISDLPSCAAVLGGAGR